MSGPTLVCSVGEVEQGKIKRVQIGDKVLAIYNIEGTIYATDGICTHAQYDLAAEGELIGDLVECPAHFGQFHVPTGKAVTRPCIQPLKTYEVAVDGDQIYIALD